MGDGVPSSSSSGPHIGNSHPPQHSTPSTEPSQKPQGNLVVDSRAQGPHQAQHAFSSQLDMTQVATPNRQPPGTGPFHMGQMAAALPQTYPPYRQGQYPPPAQPRYGLQSPVTMPQMPHMQQYGQGGAQVPGQGYYMPQQFYHGQMPPPPQQQQQQPQQQQQQQQPAMSPRMNMAYYQHPMVVGQPPGYYYPPSNHFHNQGQQMPGHMMAQPYATGNHVAMDQRAIVPPTGSDRGSAPVGSEGGDKTNVVRGPPRKPRQSGHAVWIGNLPPQTDLMSLVHHVCKEAPGLESLFLISKSNCAFANFKDERTCMAAQQKIHDSNFQTVRLVSRLRKSTVEGAAGVTAPTGPSSSAAGQHHTEPATPLPAPESGKTSPTIAQTPGSKAGAGVGAGANINADGTGPRERFFILKSLTVEDLELSVRTGIWATQSHNEQTLNNAFKAADSVYLIFSANKSGEYFGYARMTSPINDDPDAAIEFAPKAQVANTVDLPKAIPTEATEFAPKGRIIDDSARGTIFWEADRDEQATEDGVTDGVAGVTTKDGVAVEVHEEDGQEEAAKTWGKPFCLEWMSTTRLPFYRTRGLRNPWNSNREVKIARDGTELEPAVGKKLVALFFNWANAPAPGVSMPGPVLVGYPPMPRG